MENRNIVIANTPFNPHFTQGERRRGVRYIVATYGNVKARECLQKTLEHIKQVKSVTTTKTEENKV